MKDIITLEATRNQRISDILPFSEKGIPANSFIFKGKCGIGGTTLELEHPRNSIIIMPTTPPITGKLQVAKDNECVPHGNKFPLYGSKQKAKKIESLKAFLQSDIENKKILTTPDSFSLIIDAAKGIDKLDWLYDSFFLLIDESHSFISEKYRKRILEPFRYLWNFKELAFISATPYTFTDQNFCRLDVYSIRFTERLGTIRLAETKSPKAALDYILMHPSEYPGNVHIFYNSIVSMAEIVRIVKQDNPEFDCNIFCNGSDENLNKLDDLKQFFREIPKDNNYKKFNLYTTRYFEAWDLIDDTDVTLILLTDIQDPATKVGITNKGVQAIGRLRFKNPHDIIHITNTRGTIESCTIEALHEQTKHDAESAIKAYNDNLKDSSQKELAPLQHFAECAERYADFDEVTKEATYSAHKVDQWVNLAISNQTYNSLTFIKKAWEDAYYDVESFSLMDQHLSEIKLRSKAQKIKAWCQQLDVMEKHRSTLYFAKEFEHAMERVIEDQEIMQFAYKAYHSLGIDKLEKLNYSEAAIKKELIKHSIEHAKTKIKADIPNLFELKRYTKSDTKTKLQQLYDKHRLTNEKGKPAVAKGTDIKNFCNVKEGKYDFTILDY